MRQSKGKNKVPYNLNEIDSFLESLEKKTTTSPAPTKTKKGAIDYRSIVEEFAPKYPEIPKDIVENLIIRESSGDPYATADTKKKYGMARGIGQFIDETAARFIPDWKDPSDSYNPRKSIEGTYRYLTHLKKQTGGDIRRAIELYHGGGTDVFGTRSTDYAQDILGGGGSATSDRQESYSLEDIDSFLASLEKPTEGAEGQQVAGGTTTPPQQLPGQEQAPAQQVAANLPTTEDLRRAGPESFQKQLSPEEYKKQFEGVSPIPEAPIASREPLMSESDIGKLIPQKETAPASSTDVALSLDKKGKGKQPTREMILNDPAAIFESTGEDYEPVQSFDDMRTEVRKEYIKRGEDIYKKQQWYESVGKEYPAWIDPAKKMSKDDRMALSIYLFDKKIGPASAYVSSTAASSTLNLFPESKAQKEAQAEQPVASTVGNIQGGISSALLVGGLVRNAALGIPWVAQFASAGKAMKAMTAAEKIGRITFDATTRGVAVGGVNLLRRNEDLLSGDPDRIKDALKETATGVGVAIAGAIPETALPRGWIQIPAQLITDFAAQSLGDAILLDRNVFTPEYWKSKENVTNFWTNIGSSIVFSLRDVAKPGAKISAKPSGIEESLDNTVNAISARKIEKETRKAEKETKQVLKALEREFNKAKAMGLDGIHIDGKYYYVSKGFDEISREAIKKEVGKPST